MSRKFSGRSLAVLFIMALLALSFNFAYSVTQYSETLRVGLTRFKGITSVTFTADHNLSVLSLSDGIKIASANKNTPLMLQVSNGKLSIAKGSDVTVSSAKSVLIQPTDLCAVTSVDCGRFRGRYRGMVEVTLTNGRLRLVNLIGLEDYLLGVVPSEMPARYPSEALKAQAIAARTFAVRGLNRHALEGFDLCDCEHCQTYSGATCEREESTQAVRATCGMVVTYKGELASTMYCADCGGITQSFGESYQSEEVPYLLSVREPDGILHCEWERVTSRNEVATLLSRCGAPLEAKVTSARVKETFSSGRVRMVELVTDFGLFTLSGQEMRSALGLKSTLFVVESTEQWLLRIRGRGHGHGIGMCQVGAKSLAQPPYNYTAAQILAHYFPGTTVTQLEKSYAAATYPALSTNTRIVKPESQRQKSSQKRRKKLFNLRLKIPRL